MNLFFILLGILVNFIWGLAFFVPYYLDKVDPILLVLSRYFFYGLISLILLVVTQAHWRSLTRLDWQKAMVFSFAGAIGYYMTLVLAIHYAGIVLPTLIVGALPVTMMVYGNIKNKEFPFRQLILPSLLMATGILGLKWFQHADVTTQKDLLSVMIGSFWALVALIIWTWYGVANANYLKQNFTISGYTWSLASGLCCLVQVILLFPLYALFNREPFLVSFGNNHSLYQVIVGGIILGVVVSWLTTVLWNKISRQLPTAFIGQLLVFETISSLLYGYAYDGVFPELSILICISIVLLGILMGIHVTLKRKDYIKESV